MSIFPDWKCTFIHCTPCSDSDDDNWMANTLKFESDDPVLAKDASTKDDDWFDIYDPRNPVNKRRRERDSKQKNKK